MPSDRSLFADLATAALRLAEALIAAKAVQWQPGARIRGEGDGGKGKGTVSDPTFAIVSDPRRLKVRAAVLEATRTVRIATRELTRAADTLTEAVAEWEGQR